MRAIVLTLAALCTTPSHAAEMTAAWATWVRAAPDKIARIVDELPAGRAVDTLACTGGWCRIAPSAFPAYVPEAMLVPLPRPALARAPGDCLDAIHATPAGPIALRICPAAPTPADPRVAAAPAPRDKGALPPRNPRVPDQPAPAPELCVVVPVLNERGNVAPLVDRLRTTLAGVAWELVFVDDGSTDGTRAAITAIGLQDSRVRLLYRTGRRGLATAFIEGVECSLAPVVAAMDGDLQHDETLLPRMLEVLRTEPVDIVIGSRHVEGGGLGDWDGRRAGMSSLATRLAGLVLRVQVSDPMSGFFMLPRTVFDRAAPRLSALGFKILLDLLASLPAAPRVKELPYHFRSRVSGASKLDAGVLFDYLMLLLDKLVGQVVPVRFVVFAGIGAIGLVAHLVVLRLGLRWAGLGFTEAQALATACAIVGNFVLNNVITFRERKLRGVRLIRGLAVFSIVCAIGAVANLNIAALMVDAGRQSWWLAGIVGAAMSLVWNYAVGSTLTWRAGRR